MKGKAFLLLLSIAVAAACGAAERFMGAAVYADYAYASYTSPKGCSVAVVDLSSREVFRVATRLSREGRCVGAPIVSGDVFYLPLAAGVEAFDVSNPERPAFLCRLDGALCGGVESVAATGDRLSVKGPTGVLTYSIQDPFSPTLVAASKGTAPSAEAAKTTSVGDFVIFPRPAAAPGNGHQLVSAQIDDGTNLVALSSLAVAALPTGFAHGEAPNLFFYANGLSAGLLEIAPDGALADRGVFFTAEDASRGPLSVACDGRGLVALACRNDGVRIFSAKAFAADAITPATVIATHGDARAVAFANGKLYVADGTHGAMVYAVDDDGLVTLAADYILPDGAATAVAADGATAFLAGEETLAARLGGAISGHGALHEIAREKAARGRASDIAALRRGGRTLAAIADGEGGVVLADLQGPDTTAILARLCPAGGRKANITALCVVGNAICAFDPATGPHLLPLPKGLGAAGD